MFKVFGFVKKNNNLSHDDYRAGHAGYHNSFGRRLKNIRGYILNVRSNRDLVKDYKNSEIIREISLNEPKNFDNQWNGFGQLMFDDYYDYINAKQATLDKAGPGGLELDQMVAKVGDDFNHLYSGSPFQFNVDETIISPVIRPEKKLFKIIQFIKKKNDVNPILYSSYLKGKYCSIFSDIKGLKGLIINQRTSLDVMTNFFKPDAECFSNRGIKRREKFYDCWDTLIEYWFLNYENFFKGRFDKKLLTYINNFENKYFEKSFYREVDETVAVMPKRNISTDFYHR